MTAHTTSTLFLRSLTIGRATCEELDRAYRTAPRTISYLVELWQVGRRYTLPECVMAERLRELDQTHRQD